MVSRKRVNFISDTESYNFKNYIFQLQNKNSNKKHTITAIKNELKYNPMSEGNICIAEPNLEVLLLRQFSKGPA